MPSSYILMKERVVYVIYRITPPYQFKTKTRDINFQYFINKETICVHALCIFVKIIRNKYFIVNNNLFYYSYIFEMEYVIVSLRDFKS